MAVAFYNSIRLSFIIRVVDVLSVAVAEQIVQPEREQRASHRETFVLAKFCPRPVNSTVRRLPVSTNANLSNDLVNRRPMLGFN